MELSVSSSHPRNMHGAHAAVPSFDNVRGLSHPYSKRDDPVNLAIYNSLPVDTIETRLYQRAHAALADPAIQQLPKEAQVPYIAWALRDAERIEPIKNEFTEIGQSADIQQIPTGAISDFLARRTIGGEYRDGISALLSLGLFAGKASQQLNMLAFRLRMIQGRIEHPMPIELGELGGDLSNNPKLVHVQLQVPDRVAPQIADINSGSARTRLWWDSSSADKNILRLRPQGPMPTLDNEIFEMSPEEESEYEAKQAAAKKAAEDEQAAEREREAARLKERASFNPNYRFAQSQPEASNSTPLSTGTSNRFRRVNLGDQAYDQAAREAQIMRKREAEAEQSIPGSRYERNQNEILAAQEEKKAGDVRSELDAAKIKLRNLEEQVTPDVLQRISNASALSEQKALEKAQQACSNANQRLNAAHERLVEANQNSKLYELAQIKKGAAQAECRTSSAREDQAQTRVELAIIRSRTNAIKKEINSQSTLSNLSSKFTNGMESVYNRLGSNVPPPAANRTNVDNGSASRRAGSPLREFYIIDTKTGIGRTAKMTQDQYDQYVGN
jgi:hypothetical protein